MNSKQKLVVVVVLSCFFLTGCHPRVEQAVRAETNVSSSHVQETVPVKVSSAALASTGSEVSESTLPSEVSSSAEAKSSETVKAVSNASSTVLDESRAATEASAAPLPVSSEAVAEVQLPVPAQKREAHYQFSVTKNQTTDAFIQAIGKDAQQIAWDKGLYASVMIAQAILETGSGNSQLARPPHHNLFGIKGSYQGKQVSFPTKEDPGNGQLYMVQSAFRQYPSYKESLEDYASLLKNGLSGNPSFYQGTWKDNTATYQEATKALTGRYATDTSYDKKLNALIETYELTAYDLEPMEVSEAEGSIEAMKQLPKEASQSETGKETVEKSKVTESITKQPVVAAEKPIAQRPAKQVAGKQIVE